MKAILLLMCAAIALWIVYLIMFCFEYNMCMIRHQIPFAASNQRHRRAVSDEINTHYANMKTVCDIGSGYGGLARYIARHSKMRVIGLENMPMTALIAKVGCIFCPRAKTVWCDAFQYLDTCDGFDIGIAYMGPGVNNMIGKYKNKFRVIITLDVPIENMRPTRTVEIGHGCTTYGRLGHRRKFPHKLFIYEMK